MTTSTDRFRSLHADGTFVMPNPYDLGSARLLAALGFQALASTSAGFAATLGRLDMMVGREELLERIAQKEPAQIPEERAAAPSGSQVEALMDALKASVEQAKQKQPKRSSRKRTA